MCRAYSSKCQLFTDEGSRRLPKRLNYCFSVLASATNRSITVYFVFTHLFIACEATIRKDKLGVIT